VPVGVEEKRERCYIFKISVNFNMTHLAAGGETCYLDGRKKILFVSSLIFQMLIERLKCIAQKYSA